MSVPAQYSPVERLKIAVATVGGVGFTPVLPGTAGTALGVIAAAAVWFVAPSAGITPEALHLLWAAAVCVVFALGLWATPFAEQRWGHDASRIVIDELAGIWLVVACIFPVLPYSHSPTTVAALLGAGFCLFRLFDIAKPFPINLLNQQKGAFFVMADDLLAAIYASGGVYLLKFICQLFEK